jgi:O-antigen/teichoic acid export membrane protein
MINIAKILQHNVIGKLLNHSVVFLINILIVRMLGAGQSGLYFNELYLLNFVAFICSLGLDFAVIALLAQEPRLLQKLLQKLLWVMLAATIFFMLLAFALIPAAVGQWFLQPAWAIVLFATGNLLLILYQGVLSALRKFNLQNVILIISNSIFLVYLYLNYESEATFSLPQLAQVYGLLLFVQGAIMFAASYKKVPVNNLQISWTSFIKPGFMVMISSIIYFAFLRIDNFFVEAYCPADVLGNYVQCGKIGQYFIYFSSIISSTLLPFIAKETVGSSYQEWRSMMKPYLLLICLAAVVVAIAGPWVFPLLFGAGFANMHQLMLILLPGYICLGMLTLINSVYIGKGNIKPILLADIAALILIVVLDAWLVPRFGVFAAATISSICYIAVFLILFRNFKQQFQVKPRQQGIIGL